jgi:hypothetical protein
MTDTPPPAPFNPAEIVPWIQCDIALRGLYQKDIMDFEKLAADFSKFVISSLFVLNVGGFGTIPALSHIFDFTKLSLAQKVQLFSVPLGLFLLGAVSSLLSAFAAYLNFQFAASWHRGQSQQDVIGFRLLHPQNHTSAENYEAIQAQMRLAKQLTDSSWARLRRLFMGSLITGSLSMLFFICGCIALAFAIYNLP